MGVWFQQIRNWNFGFQPWRRLPEFKRLNSADADKLYSTALKRSLRTPSFWISIGLGITLLTLFIGLRDLIRSYFGWFMAIVSPLTGIGIGYLMFQVNRATLRRCVRTILGTHCSVCDYDLR